MATPIPQGKVQLTDGTIVDRADVCFTLIKYKEHQDIEIAADGTIYHRLPNGSLRRLSFKKHERKAKR